jgi:hypothetical protein
MTHGMDLKHYIHMGFCLWNFPTHNGLKKIKKKKKKETSLNLEEFKIIIK